MKKSRGIVAFFYHYYYYYYYYHYYYYYSCYYYYYYYYYHHHHHHHHHHSYNYNDSYATLHYNTLIKLQYVTATNAKLKDRRTPHVTNFFRLRPSIEKQEGKRKYKSECSCTVSE